jgi:hypothetical protein
MSGDMTLQLANYQPLPAREDLQAWVDEQERHAGDLTSHMWHIIPVAERFGDSVYAVAAQSLKASGFDVTAEQLKALADELKTPAGLQKYAEQRRRHVMMHTTG